MKEIWLKIVAVTFASPDEVSVQFEGDQSEPGTQWWPVKIKKGKELEIHGLIDKGLDNDRRVLGKLEAENVTESGSSKESSNLVCTQIKTIRDGSR